MSETSSFNDLSFYEIRSLDALRLVKGVRKRTLACGDEASIHFFIWSDQNNKIHQIQSLIEEKIVTWHFRTGFKTGYTNRHHQGSENVPLHVGVAKGSRTVEESDDKNLLRILVSLINTGSFPGDLQEDMKECFQFPKGVSAEEQQKRIQARQVDDGFHPWVRLLPCAVFSLIGAADGHIDNKEWAILECYASDEFPIQSTLLKLVFQQVRSDPSYLGECRDAFEKEDSSRTLMQIRRFIAMISHSLSKQAFSDLKKDLFLLALNTARASGGMLGMYKISKEEKEELQKLAELFQMTEMFEKLLAKGE